MTLPAVINSPTRAAGVAALLGVVVYLGALGNGFAYDDNVLILGDPGIQQLTGLGDRLMQPSWPAAFGDEIGAWRPVTTGTWALTWSAGGGSPVAFHALGVLLHALATGLTVLLLAALVPLTVAVAAGVVFAVHPVHVEAVANVAGTAEPLSAALALGAALVHVRGGRSYGLGRVVMVTLLYTVAVLAKEGAAVLPLLIVVLDAARDELPVRRLMYYARDRATLFLTMTAALAVVLLFRWDVVGAVAAASHPPGAEILRDAPRSWTVFSTWPHYVRLLFLPFDLVADYGPGIVAVTFRWSAGALLGVVLGLSSFFGAWIIWRHSERLAPDTGSARTVVLGVLWIAAALLPVANVLYLGPVLVAERTFYLASVGAAAIVGWVLVELAAREGRAALALAAVVIAAYGARTVTRVPDWDDSETVMAALIEDHPESGTGWMFLGRQLAQQGRADDALTAFGYAVHFLGSEYRPSTEVGAHLMAMGRPDAASFFLMRAWREHPEWYTAPGLLAAAQLNAGRADRAVPAARAATLLQPTNPSMHHLLAQALAAQGDWPAAARARAASLNTGFSDRGRTWILLAVDHTNAGDTTAAIAALDSAAVRSLDPAERNQVEEGLRALSRSR